MDNRTTIVSQAVSDRNKQIEDLKKSQHTQMDQRLMEKPLHSFQQSLSASGDSYIAAALNKVRKSNVTHHESLTRLSGTWLHNESMKPSKGK
jgi:hypothetical protein